MLNYILNIEKSWWIFLVIIFLLCIVLYKKYKLWCDDNKKIFILLIISIIVSIGNFLPSWNNSLVKYYELLNNISLSYITGFIFYWFTCVEKEKKVLEIYYFESIELLVKYLEVIAISYYKNKYEPLNIYQEDIMSEITISIPLEKYKEFFHIDKKLEESLISKANSDIKKQKEKLEEYLKNIKKLKISEEKKVELKKIEIDRFNNYKNQEFKGMLTFFKEYNNFKKNNSFNYLSIDVEKIIKFDRILKQIKNYEIKENEGDYLNIYKLLEKYKIFIKNIVFIQEDIKKNLDERIRYLNFYKKYIPSIELKFSAFYFSKGLSANMAAFIFKDLYKDIKLTKILILYDRDTRDKIRVKIKEIKEDSTIIAEDNKEYNFSFITQIYIEKNNVVLLYQN